MLGPPRPKACREPLQGRLGCFLEERRGEERRGEERRGEERRGEERRGEERRGEERRGEERRGEERRGEERRGEESSLEGAGGFGPCWCQACLFGAFGEGGRGHKALSCQSPRSLKPKAPAS